MNFSKIKKSSNFPDPLFPQLGYGPLVNSTRYGVKAANLDRLCRQGFPIPDGFILAPEIITQISSNNCSEKILQKLQTKLKSLNSKVIVRSSSILEENDDYQFNGIFSTTSDVSSFEELILAVKDSYLNGNSDRIVEYCDSINKEFKPNHLAIIVQNQITCQYSAVVYFSFDNIYAEIYDGQLNYGISGTEKPTTMKILGREISQMKIINNFQDIHVQNLEEIAEFLLTLDYKIENNFDRRSICELGFNASGLHLFQIRFLHHDKGLLSDKNAPSKQTLDDSPFESKAEAMRFFQRNNLFSLPLSVISPRNDQVDFAKLTVLDNSDGPFTVRFSSGNQLNLPRFFLPSKNEVIKCIKENYEPGWSIIVHEYIDLKHSFEILISRDNIVLEHIPGIWESDNTLPPDFMVVNQNSETARLWRKKRTGCIIDATGSHQEIFTPVSMVEALEWLRKLKLIMPTIELLTVEKSEVILHFIEDFSGRWHFLNIRAGFSPSLVHFANLPLFPVESLKDLSEWDNKSSILLKISTQRGNKDDLLDLVRALPRNKLDIFVENGILSHPAMLLRENGINVSPLHTIDPSLNSSSDYLEVVFMNLDYGNDPIDRIKAEPSLISSQKFHVVEDIDPIVSNHLLIMPHDKFTSLADMGDRLRNLLTSTIKNLSENRFNRTPFFLLERGRARFCTSGFTDKHAHAHILPTHEFTSLTLDELINITKAEKFESLGSAFSSVSESSSEYFLFSLNGDQTWVAHTGKTFNPEKRFFRNFFSQRRANVI
jgi:diadenosine tetraphosphate (Ap4A) HIT family hydrolase